jgi:uncharacterized membrane protein required for colicin V production
MTALDLIVLAVIALSVVFAYFRGVVREVIALAAWIVGLVAAFRYMDQVATIFSGLDVTPAVRHVLAFVLILVAFMIAGRSSHGCSGAPCTPSAWALSTASWARCSALRAAH